MIDSGVSLIKPHTAHRLFLAALEKQRQMYEQQIQLLKKECFSPMTPSMEFMGKTPGTPSFPLSSVQARYVQWARAR